VNIWGCSSVGRALASKKPKVGGSNPSFSTIINQNSIIMTTFTTKISIELSPIEVEILKKLLEAKDNVYYINGNQDDDKYEPHIYDMDDKGLVIAVRLVKGGLDSVILTDIGQAFAKHIFKI
jgi:hypothetical protein